jgi:hypothetical protein
MTFYNGPTMNEFDGRATLPRPYQYCWAVWQEGNERARMISAEKVEVSGGALVFYGRDDMPCTMFGQGTWERCEFHHSSDYPVNFKSPEGAL